MPWTKKEVIKLKKLVKNKYSLKQAGEELGKTRNAVAGKCHRLGLIVNSGIQRGPRMTLKENDYIVLRAIHTNTDEYGWGLEMDEIIEFTELPFRQAHLSISNLLKGRYINKTTSFVADHIFYNNATIKQVGI